MEGEPPRRKTMGLARFPWRVRKMLLQAAWHYLRGHEVLPYLPIRLWVEPTSYCNLRCVMCPQSFPRAHAKGYMDWDLFRKIIDEAAEFVYDINLHHTGESTLHKRLPDMIAYARQAGIYTRLHSNGTLLREDLAHALIDAGLDLLSFSFDGFDKETYESIRVNARFEKTLANIIRFLEIKKARNSKKPYTILEVIHLNERLSPDSPQRYEFERQFEGLPLDEFIVKEPHNWAGSYDRSGYAIGHVFTPCTFPWYALVIHWDGRVAPCPQDFYCDLQVGHVREQTLRAIWNGEPMRRLRRAMRLRDCSKVVPCRDCDMIRRKAVLGVPTPYLKVFLKETVLGYSGQ
jgi:radical SAM protein with 4Fe4S-binding SPASM domain